MGYFVPAREKPPGEFVPSTIDHCYVAVSGRCIDLSSLDQGGKSVLAEIGDEHLEDRLPKFEVLLDYPLEVVISTNFFKDKPNSLADKLLQIVNRFDVWSASEPGRNFLMAKF